MISGRLSGRAIVYSGYSGGTVTDLHRVPFIELSLCVPVAQVRQPTIFTVKRTIPKTRDFFRQAEEEGGACFSLLFWRIWVYKGGRIAATLAWLLTPPGRQLLHGLLTGLASSGTLF